MPAVVCTSLVLLIAISARVVSLNNEAEIETTELPEPLTESSIYYISQLDAQFDDQEGRISRKNISAIENNGAAAKPQKLKNQKRKNSALKEAVEAASLQGFNAMIDLYERKEPEILRKGEFLDMNHPAAKLSLFSAPMTNDSDVEVKGAYASLYAAKKLQESLNLDFTGLGRQASKKRISLKRTTLENFCPPRDPPQCLPATKRYRTHDGTCNNIRRPRWGSAHMPFHRFMAPDYSDGLETMRTAASGDQLPSARFVSLVVHGYREEEAPITMMLAQWGQLVDHDVTATLQPRSINGSIPSCCRSQEPHPACLPIKVPRDDPFLAQLGVRCLEFLRSAPAQRRDCLLSWREQSNQATSFIDASPVYSSNPRTADSSRILRDGLLLYGRGPPREDPCLRGGFGHQCIRAGDTRAGEQPGLLALHTVFVAEHNRITLDLADLNPHWSDEKLYQETRRIIGAIFQHITYREFLPLVLGKEVCRLFDLDLESSGFYHGYDPRVNPTIANSFSTAAFRFGHSLIQGSILRSDASYRFLSNNVSLHEENAHGDIGGAGSLHRIIRGMATQRTLKRDEFMSPELTNHLFQSSPFPFGMDLAAINIQRGRDHGLPPYVDWRQPCGLSAIRNWDDLERIVGVNSADRMRRAYDSVNDIDLFVGGISERPVMGGLVGPTFACIIAQQFSNLKKGDRFWYENADFESSFTPAQLHTLRQVSLSQILCRSLGSQNLLQPHVFLPPEFPGNERLSCGRGILTPMSLSAWIERDPFHKEADFPNLNVISTDEHDFNIIPPRPVSPTTPQVIVANPRPQTSGKPVSQLDFDNEPQVIITARPKPNPLSTTVDNKIDFFSSTTFKPKKRRTASTSRRTTTKTTRLPTPTIISNKIDFVEVSTIQSSNIIFSKLGKESEIPKTTSKKRKRSTDSKITKPRRTRMKLDNDRVSDKVSNIFLNLDKASKYINNQPIRARLDDEQFDKVENTKIKNNSFLKENVNLSTKLEIASTMSIENFDEKNTLKPDMTEQNFPDSQPRTPDISSRIDDFVDSKLDVSSSDPQSRYTVYLTTKRYGIDFEHNDDQYRPYYDYGPGPGPRPIQNQYQTSKRPTSFYNNRPHYDENRPHYDENRPHYDDNRPSRPNFDEYRPNRPTIEGYRPTDSPLSIKYSTPFSYDTYNVQPGSISSMSPQINYDNMAIPLYVSPNRPRPIYSRPTYATTRRSDLSTFYFIETTKPSNFFDYRRTTKRSKPDLDYLLSHSTPSPIFVLSPSPIEVDEPTNLSYFVSSSDTNKISAIHRPVSKPQTVFSYDTKPTNDDFDGYLRPEQTFYYPLNKKRKPTYNDYSKYNMKPETSTASNVKFVYLENVLHQFYEGKSGVDGVDVKEGLFYGKANDRRYAEGFDQHLTDDKIDDFVTMTRTLTENKNETLGTTNEIRLDGRSKNGPQNIFLVPFKLLTNVDRPDNWVNTDKPLKDVDTKSRLPDVPELVQDGDITSELPKPFFGKLRG